MKPYKYWMNTFVDFRTPSKKNFERIFNNFFLLIKCSPTLSFKFQIKPFNLRFYIFWLFYNVINSNKYFKTEKFHMIQFWQETRIDNSLNSHLKWYFSHIEKTYFPNKSVHQHLAKINIWKFSHLENVESQNPAAG